MPSPNPFQQLLSQIPFGKITTYAQLSHLLHTSPRRIGQLCAKNTDIHLYPCYKVVHADGRIGQYQLGIEEKTRLLEKEGIWILNGKVEDFEKRLWENSP